MSDNTEGLVPLQSENEYEIEIDAWVEGEDPEFDRRVEAGAQAFEEVLGAREITDFDRVMAGIAANRRREAARSRFVKEQMSEKDWTRHQKAVQKRKKSKRGGPR